MLASGILMTVLMDEEKRTNWLDTLYQHGLGVSDVQEALVTVLSDVDSPLTADEIWEETQRIRPETGRATVYRFIDKLLAAGLLRRIHGYRNCSAYIPALDTHQPLLVCTACGQVSYLDPTLCVSVNEAVEAIRRELSGHHVTGYQLQLFEVCITCQLDNS